MMANVSSAPEKPAARPAKRKSGVVVPHAPTWYQRAVARFIHLLARAVAATLRYRWDDRSGASERAPGEPVIFCTWHNRLALSMEAYRVYSGKHPGPGLAAMVSASKDGGFLAAILECFGVQPVRGSTSRRGPQALLELTTWAERGYDLAITPDGPRGPCGVVQEGAMGLAQLTGLAVVPFSYRARWKIQARSWDRFQIPLPFSVCDMTMGAPLRVPPDATDEQRETLRLHLEQTLREISRD